MLQVRDSCLSLILLQAVNLWKDYWRQFINFHLVKWMRFSFLQRWTALFWWHWQTVWTWEQLQCSTSKHQRNHFLVASTHPWINPVNCVYWGRTNCSKSQVSSLFGTFSAWEVVLKTRKWHNALMHSFFCEYLCWHLVKQMITSKAWKKRGLGMYDNLNQVRFRKRTVSFIYSWSSWIWDSSAASLPPIVCLHIPV